MRIRYAFFLAGVVLLLAVLGQMGGAQQAPARNTDADWPMSNRDLAGTRFSPLTQINATNVTTLTKAWSYQLQPATGNIAPAPALASEVFQEVTPIVVNGVMYLPSGNRVVALQSDTGKEIWSYSLAKGLASFRGVAYWPGDASNPPRILFTTAKKMVALNANTGKVETKFGDNGEIDMKVAYAGVPLVYKNMIFVGAMIFGPGEQHLDAGTYATGPAMNPRGYDVRTGEKVWEFNSIPLPGEFGNDTWLNDSWKGKIGPNVWALTLTMDEQRGIVYLPIGGPNNNYYGGNRPGNNLFANTLVAVNAETGKRLWHFQTVHHDLWDYDLPPAPVLLDVVKDGRTIPALAQSGKLGLMFILNRQTGEPVFGVEERVVAKGDVPGEWYSPTQPIPVKPPPVARIEIKDSDLVTAEDTSPEHAKACLDLWQSGRFYNAGPYTPWRLQKEGAPTSLVIPGFTGGPNWGGSAADTKMGYVFVNSKDAAVTSSMQKNPRYNETTAATELPYTRTGGPNFSAAMPIPGGRSLNLPCFKPPWASLVAVNANTGDIAWKVPLGINDAMPEGKKNVGSAGSGGPIATAGGLIFIGATADNRFRAFDSKTGKELWSARTDNTITATPMTYQARNGKQYVAVVAASGTSGPTQSVVVYALP
jgi:quinoprotein glucose dehydrogenase